jgi:RNA-directed DNA polymerase
VAEVAIRHVCVGKVRNQTTPLDRQWRERFRRLGVLIRYADDEVICCPTEDRARAALVALREILGELGLRVSAAKTRIVGVASGVNGFAFLGFHHRMVSSRRYPARRHPACWPSVKAMNQARSRIRG